MAPTLTARVQAKIVSRELNVRQVLAKIVLGEADAGVVYRSDAIAAKGKVVMVEIPAELNVTAAYPIATLKAAPHPDARARLHRPGPLTVGGRRAARGGVRPCPGR